MSARLLAILILVTCGGGVAGSACNGPQQAPVCTDIPDGGCPDDYDAGYCTDPTCETLYACTSSGWVEIGTCPPHPMEAGPNAPDAMEAAAMPDVNLADAPLGAFGGACQPGLDDTDCQLGTALLCSPADDCCSCMDLYVCVDMNWVLWGQCTDAGVVPNK